MQLANEEIYTLKAKQVNASLIIFDRGVLDGAAYYLGGLKSFLNDFGFTLEEIYKRYNMVIHLESQAVCNPKNYNNQSNKYRFSTLKEATKDEIYLRNIWKRHSDWQFVSGKEGKDCTINAVIKIIEKII